MNFSDIAIPVLQNAAALLSLLRKYVNVPAPTGRTDLLMYICKFRCAGRITTVPARTLSVFLLGVPDARTCSRKETCLRISFNRGDPSVPGPRRVCWIVKLLSMLVRHHLSPLPQSDVIVVHVHRQLISHICTFPNPRWCVCPTFCQHNRTSDTNKTLIRKLKSSRFGAHINPLGNSIFK